MKFRFEKGKEYRFRAGMPFRNTSIAHWQSPFVAAGFAAQAWQFLGVKRGRLVITWSGVVLTVAPSTALRYVVKGKA